MGLELVLMLVLTLARQVVSARVSSNGRRDGWAKSADGANASTCPKILDAHDADVVLRLICLYADMALDSYLHTILPVF